MRSEFVGSPLWFLGLSPFAPCSDVEAVRSSRVTQQLATNRTLLAPLGVSVPKTLTHKLFARCSFINIESSYCMFT